MPNDPFSLFSLSVFAVNGVLMRSGDIITRSLGQSSARWQVLGRAGYQPQTVSQMARDMGASRQSVQYTADTLAKEGLILYADNPADRRARVLRLTPKGSDVLAAIYARDHVWTQRVMADLNPAQLLELAQALESVTRIVETHLDRDISAKNKEHNHEDNNI